MADFANIQLAGRLGQDPELSYSGQGLAILRFSVAVSTGRKDNKNTSWYRCVMFGKQGEALSPHLKKGSSVIVGGEPVIKEYTTNSGVKRKTVDVNVKTFAFGGGNQQSGAQHVADNEEVPF